MPEPTRTGLGPDALRRALLDNLACLQGRYPEIATPRDWYMALAYTVRDRMLARWVNTVKAYAAHHVKVVCYLSAEFLIGPQLANNLINLGIEANVRASLGALGQDLNVLLPLERRAGPWQRRSGSAGSLLPGFPGHARNSRHWLRHSLRVRHF